MPPPVASPSARARRTRVWFVTLLALLVVGIAAAWWQSRRTLRAASVSVQPASASARGNSALVNEQGPNNPLAARWKDEPAPPLPSGNNAADLYKNAFALFNQLTTEEKEIFRSKKELNAEDAATLFAKIQPILELLRRAREMPECDWGTGPFGLNTPTPQVTAAMRLTHVVRWGAEHQFSTEPDAAIDDLLAISHLGRHISGALIGLLAERSIDGISAATLRTHLSSLPESALDRVSELLELRRAVGSITQAFEMEAAFIHSAVKFMSGPEGNLEKQADQIVSMLPDPSAEGPLRRMVNDPVALAAEEDFMVGIHKQSGAAMLWPEVRFEGWWKSVEASMEGNRHPLAELILPALKEAYIVVQNGRIQTEMLAAAVAVMRNGPEALAAFRDPATEKPFTLVEKPGGFELQSTFIARKKPVTMFFPSSAPALADP